MVSGPRGSDLGGGWATHALFGTGGHTDMSGLPGAILGMPLGGGLSVYLALAVGRWVEFAEIGCGEDHDHAVGSG